MHGNTQLTIGLKMRILLSYSKNHFDPSLPQEQQESWSSSASILARTLYRLLCDLGEVRYIDLTEVDLVRGDEFDLFVGIITNFTLIRSACSIRRSVLFAVNMHPLERTSILRRRISTTTPNDVRAEILNETHHYRWAASAIEEADAIICVGNAVTLKSYFERGVPLKKIKVINYGVGPSRLSLEPRRLKPPVRQLLYISSDIGLRKGFDIIEAAIRSIVSEGIPFHLDILGEALRPSYQDRVQKLVELKPDAISFHGWINSSTASYDEIVGSCDYILAPSLEEGQLGAVLDALRQGVVPISSAYTGIDFSPLGILTPNPNDPHNVVLLKSALQKSDDEIDALKAHALDYYRLFHEPFEINLRSTLNEAISGGLHPKISIVLPIFNKEQSILKLLQLLHKAADAYENVEVRIIFDGCVDRTEELVRDFYQRAQAPYEVYFETTPDIFETKSNNIGLKKSTGKYSVIIQDDNYIRDPLHLFEFAAILEKAPRIAILGGLAGVNYFPRGTTGLSGTGQIIMDDNEVYWRQDSVTDPALQDQLFEVDACMRGPLWVRSSFLEEHGYLDEIYAPFYQDDIDLCFRAKSNGYRVFAMLANVENRQLTMSAYGADRAAMVRRVTRRNTDQFYARYTPSVEKNYLRTLRPPFPKPSEAPDNRSIIVRLREDASENITAMREELQFQAKRWLRGVVKLMRIVDRHLFGAAIAESRRRRREGG